MTSANLYIKEDDIYFSLDSDGYPEYVIPEIIEYIQKANNKKECFIGYLMMDWLTIGHRWQPFGDSLASYNYLLEWEKNRVSWMRDEVIISINYKEKTIITWEDIKSAHYFESQLTDLIKKYREKYEETST